MAANVFLSTVVIQTLKRAIFYDVARPFIYFRDIYELHLINGVEMHHANSFPSGHSSSAFVIFFMLALITKNNSLKFIYFIIASLIAYSRVYLSQHFLIDIYFGSIISSTITLIIFYFGMKWQNNKLENSILNIFNKHK